MASANSAALADATLCLLNVERANAGLAPLIASRKLWHSAHRLGKSMVKHHFLSHIGRDGSTPLSRIRKTGFLKGFRSFKIGETLAWGESYETQPAVIVNAWMNSPMHRADILDPAFNRVGTSVTIGEPVGTRSSRINRNSATWTFDYGFVRH